MCVEGVGVGGGEVGGEGEVVVEGVEGVEMKEVEEEQRGGEREW